MIYQFLRVALCVALLTGTTANAVGKRALWNFAEAKKELQKKLSELRKMDSTADVEQSTALMNEIQGYINEVQKLDPTKASEFQEVLDASFEQEVLTLNIEAESQKQVSEKQISDKSNQIATKVEKLSETVKLAANEALTKAHNSHLLDYMSYVTVPVSWAMYPFTSLITKSYKISLRLLDFITRGKVEKIHNTYLGILKKEKEALATIIVNTSLVAALKINEFLHQVTQVDNEFDDSTKQLDGTPAKRWFLGKMYDKATGIFSGQRTKDTFSGSQLHRIVMAELLEYGALLSPVVDLTKHETLAQALINMNEYIIEIFQRIGNKVEKSIIVPQGELDLTCSIFELYWTLVSANEESKKIVDMDKKVIYPEGKLTPYLDFSKQRRDSFRSLLTTLKIDVDEQIDTRSCAAKLKDIIVAGGGAKIGAYKDDIAAVAGLALTIAGGSYLVENYFPAKFKNKYTQYAAAPISYVINTVKNYFSDTETLKQKGATALASITAKLKQLPYSDKIQAVISSTYVRAVTTISAGSAFMIGLVSKVKGASKTTAIAQESEIKEQQEMDNNEFQKDPVAESTLQELKQNPDLTTTKIISKEEMETLLRITGDNEMPQAPVQMDDTEVEL